MELPETYEGHLSENFVMEHMEPELAIFCKQARLPVVHVRHQPIHQTLDSTICPDYNMDWGNGGSECVGLINQ